MMLMSFPIHIFNLSNKKNKRKKKNHLSRNNKTKRNHLKTNKQNQLLRNNRKTRVCVKTDQLEERANLIKDSKERIPWALEKA